MPRRTFKTVSDKLLEHAQRAVDHFDAHGYSVSVEKHELGFPFTPTLVCKRQRTTLIVEIVAQIDSARVNLWMAYAKSAGQDTRLALTMPQDAPLTATQEDDLRARGVGLYITSEIGVVERTVAVDLALNVQLPPLNTLPRKVRSWLGSAYEQFQRGQWRESFEDACQSLEREARHYLLDGIRRSRITFVTRKGVKTFSAKQVNRMTLGQLADNFVIIQHQNQADAVIGKALKKINRDRVAVAHFKGKVSAERRLRSNVGAHMWTIVEALKLLA